MSSHQEDCACVVCNPIACAACGMASPKGTHLNGYGVCKHRKACEGRQMLSVGRPVAEAAAHAQGQSR